MESIIYNQGRNFTCQQYCIFGIIWHNFNQWLPQKSVEKWIAKNDLKDPKKKWWLGSIEAAEYIAKEIARKVMTFGFRDADFMKYWEQGKAIGISMKADADFWRDTVDWKLDSYKHLRWPSSHAVYIHNGSWGLMINSFWKALPPCRFDLEKFDTKWLTNLLCFTII